MIIVNNRIATVRKDNNFPCKKWKKGGPVSIKCIGGVKQHECDKCKADLFLFLSPEKNTTLTCVRMAILKGRAFAIFKTTDSQLISKKGGAQWVIRKLRLSLNSWPQTNYLTNY